MYIDKEKNLLWKNCKEVLKVIIKAVEIYIETIWL